MTSGPELTSPKLPKASDSKSTSSKLTKSRSSNDKLPKKTSNMCDCNVNIRNKKNKSGPQKQSHGAQTDSPGIDFGAILGGMVNSVGGMIDGVGPWLPYIGGSALFILLLGYMAKNIDSFLGMFESDFKHNEKPSMLAPGDAPPEPPRESQEGICACSMRIAKNRIKWPM